MVLPDNSQFNVQLIQLASMNNYISTVTIVQKILTIFGIAVRFWGDVIADLNADSILL